MDDFSLEAPLHCWFYFRSDIRTSPLLVYPLSYLHFSQVPVIAIDSTAYGRWSIVPWNIIRYNIFGGSDRGPDLYGTAPWYFYILNLLLNFNILVPLAFLSLPGLAVTYRIDRKRLEMTKTRPDQSSPFTLLALRLAPLYVWITILTAQAHKEERFMFPAYPLICFNAAVTLYLIRGWMEVAYISITKSSYKVCFPFQLATFLIHLILIGFKVHHIWCYDILHCRGGGAHLIVSCTCLVALLSRTAFHIRRP